MGHSLSSLIAIPYKMMAPPYGHHRVFFLSLVIDVVMVKGNFRHVDHPPTQQRLTGNDPQGMVIKPCRSSPNYNYCYRATVGR